MNLLLSFLIFASCIFWLLVFECKIGALLAEKLLKVSAIDFLFSNVIPFNIKMLGNLIPFQANLMFLEYF